MSSPRHSQQANAKNTKHFSSKVNAQTREILESCSKALAQVQCRERYSFIRQMQLLKNNDKSKGEDTSELKAQKLQGAMAHSIEKTAQRLSAFPAIKYEQDLPVVARRDEIKKAIAENQVVVIAGETGSGKTTQLPKICMELGLGAKGYIGHTQPRRLAARSVATRIASELNSQIGATVGYKVRFSDQFSDSSVVKLMTDGILLAEIQSDRFLSQYEVLIIDEAHERSLNLDFLMGYIKRILAKRPDLKVIITSATIDPEKFSRHFNNAPVIQVSGRTYPVELRYRPLLEEEGSETKDLSDAVCDAVDELGREGRGDILIFMNGEREIRDMAEVLNKQSFKGTEVLPLFARLSNAEQNRIFQTGGLRRIIIATNVAETSITVPGIRYVIDTGTARISRYSYRTKVQRLPIEAISQASANQRMGRCGRVSDGICIRLYSEEDFLSRPEFTDPEIVRTNLASVILQMLALRFGDIERFEFLDKPDSRQINDGIKLLEELGAIQYNAKQGHKLTASGRKLARFPIDPRLAAMVMAAANNGCLHEVMVITAALSIQDPRERPLDKQQASDQAHARFNDPDSDFISLVNLWHYINDQKAELSSNQFRKLCKAEYLSYLRVREWQDIYKQILSVVQELDYKINQESASNELIHQALLSGLLSHIGLKQAEGGYLGARNSQFHIFPGSGLKKGNAKWVMAAQLVETSRLFARMVAKISPQWIEAQAGHLVNRNYSEPHWEKKRGAVMAYESQVLYGITIVSRKKVNYGAIDQKLSREIFIRSALVEGDFYCKHAFYKHNQKLIEEISALEERSRRRDLLIDDDTLFEFYDERIPANIVSTRHLDSWWKQEQKQHPELLTLTKETLMQHDASNITEDAYPTSWRQGKLRLPLEYVFDPGGECDGVSVLIPLAVLNQVSEQGFDWLIPAYREAKVIALIRSLPKAKRKLFVPAPNYASAFLGAVEDVDMNSTSMLEALNKQLLRMTGTRLQIDDWDLDALPAHLKMNFKVMGPNNKLQAQSYDLEALKAELSGLVAKTVAKSTEKQKRSIERSGIAKIECWDLGDLPDEVIQKQGGFELKAYPALVDEKSSVAIRLVDSKEQAQAIHQQGVRRLMMLNTPSPIQYLEKKLSNNAKLALYYNPFGRVADLIEDCTRCAIDELLTRCDKVVDESSYLKARDMVRSDVADLCLEIANQVELVLSLFHDLKKRMKGKVALDQVMAFNDIKAQLEQLIYKGFVTDIGYEQVKHLPRYLKAIDKRLEKLAIDANRDRLQMLQLQSSMEEYAKLKGQYAKSFLPASVKQVRWMIEELRVSLFAQQLGTAMPISEKRIKQFIKSIVEAK